MSVAYTHGPRVVETWAEGKRNHARLLVDGEQVDAGDTDEMNQLELGRDTEHHTRIVFWWTGRVFKVTHVPDRLAYAPPAGTRGARVHAWGERHPKLYASRHVVVNVVGTAAAILGVSALLRALLPAIDLPEIDAPDVNLPDLFGWVPAIDLPDLPDLGPWPKIVIGLLIAIGVAHREYRKRRDGADRQP